ncbi:MAG: 4Fe-4S double cluster binding domain-containing protein [Bacillota bacterium]
MREKLLEQVSGMGLALVGVADPREFERHPRVRRTSISEEYWPRPREVWRNCRSVIVVGLYCPEEVFDALVRYGDRRAIFYAEIITSSLRRIGDWMRERGWEARIAQDISHKRAAILAGLGHPGRNTLVANPRYGSNLRFGVLLTDAELPFDEGNDPLAAELCRDCRRCEQVCPSGAISNYHLDFSRCLIPAAEGWPEWDEERALAARRMQRRGEHLEVECNLCQKMCPLNRSTPGECESGD